MHIAIISLALLTVWLEWTQDTVKSPIATVCYGIPIHDMSVMCRTPPTDQNGREGCTVLLLCYTNSSDPPSVFTGTVMTDCDGVWHCSLHVMPHCYGITPTSWLTGMASPWTGNQQTGDELSCILWESATLFLFLWEIILSWNYILNSLLVVVTQEWRATSQPVAMGNKDIHVLYQYINMYATYKYMCKNIYHKFIMLHVALHSHTGNVEITIGCSINIIIVSSMYKQEFLTEECAMPWYYIATFTLASCPGLSTHSAQFNAFTQEGWAQEEVAGWARLTFQK